MKNKLFLASLAAAVTIPVTVAPVQATQEVEVKGSSFSDVSSLNEETKAKIDYLVNKGVIFGFPDNTFRPDTKVTRGQFASFIARALDLPMPKNPKAFKDVTDKVSTYEGVVKAYEVGIIQGYPDGRFGPNEEITRAQMAIMMDKALQSKGSYPKKAILTYVDRGSIGKSSYEAVQRLTHYGIMDASTPANYFAPQISGDRLLTVLSVYNLLEVTGLLDDAPKPELELAVLTLTNAERQKVGLAPLKSDSRLMDSARAKSNDMSTNNYFSHTSPTYGSVSAQLTSFGITYSAWGENIAMGYRSAEEVVKAWMESPGHRENILTPYYTHIGIGYDANGNYWTQQFIRK